MLEAMPEQGSLPRPDHVAHELTVRKQACEFQQGVDQSPAFRDARVVAGGCRDLPACPLELFVGDRAVTRRGEKERLSFIPGRDALLRQVGDTLCGHVGDLRLERA